MDRFRRGKQHYVTEAKELEKFSRKPTTMEGQGKGGQGPFWAAEPLMMMKTEAQLYFSDSRRLEVTTVKGIGE
jgi:hypothetical protein